MCCYELWSCAARRRMLDFPSTRVMAYPKETVVAEKLEALVKLGMVKHPNEGLLRSVETRPTFRF